MPSTPPSRCRVQASPFVSPNPKQKKPLKPEYLTRNDRASKKKPSRKGWLLSFLLEGRLSLLSGSSSHQNDRQSRRRRATFILHSHAERLRLDALRQWRQNHAGIPARIRVERPRRNRILSFTSRNQPKLIRLRCLQRCQVGRCKDQRSLAGNIGRSPLRNSGWRALHVQRHPQRRTVGHRIENLARRRSIRGQVVDPAGLLRHSAAQRLALFVKIARRYSQTGSNRPADPRQYLAGESALRQFLLGRVDASRTASKPFVRSDACTRTC